eukprot:scaffold17071_cov67-Cylindrotheca_fusiformis.AAC.1
MRPTESCSSISSDWKFWPEVLANAASATLFTPVPRANPIDGPTTSLAFQVILRERVGIWLFIKRQLAI